MVASFLTQNLFPVYILHMLKQLRKLEKFELILNFHMSWVLEGIRTFSPIS